MKERLGELQAQILFAKSLYGIVQHATKLNEAHRKLRTVLAKAESDAGRLFGPNAIAKEDLTNLQKDYDVALEQLGCEKSAPTKAKNTLIVLQSQLDEMKVRFSKNRSALDLNPRRDGIE